MDNMTIEPFCEITNLLQCIVEGPREEDPIKRSEYFRVIQKHAERVLKKLKKEP